MSGFHILSISKDIRMSYFRMHVCVSLSVWGGDNREASDSDRVIGLIRHLTTK